MKWILAFYLLNWGPPEVAVDTIYGTYIIPKERISLNLSPPNNYTLFAMQYNRRSETVSSQELSRGEFQMLADTVVLTDITTGKAMKLLAPSEEQLYPLNVPGFDNDVVFLGRNQYYADGDLKWEGEWRRGKKHGTWIYYDELGDVIKTIRYRRGKKIE